MFLHLRQLFLYFKYYGWISLLVSVFSASYAISSYLLLSTKSCILGKSEEVRFKK